MIEYLYKSELRNIYIYFMKRQIGGLLRVLRFSQPIKLTATI